MANSNNISFAQFIRDYSIEIPRIQRDYVQGRADSVEAEEKRNNFVNSLLGALEPNGKQCRLDFLYGSINENAGKRVFIPLDGQQRLTTLFLLHWYLLHSMKGLMLDNEDESKWVTEWQQRLHGNFSYSTRESSTSFCDRLTDPSSAWIIESTESKDNKIISQIIKQQPWFDDSWINDPTVEVMLKMLDCFDKRIRGIHVDDLATLTHKLFKEQAICFDHLNLSDIHQDESLYIKMNARGKKLNSFENWKSEFTRCIADTFPEEIFENGDKDRCSLLLKDYFSYSMEHDWNNLFWELAMKDISLDTMENVLKQYPTVDKYFTNFLKYLHSILFFIDHAEKSVADFKWTMDQNKDTYFQSGKPKRLKFLFECLDFLCAVGKDIQFYDNIFYRKDEDLEEVPDNKVRDFMDGKKANLFELCAGSHVNQEQGKVVNNIDESSYFDYNHWFLLYAILKKCAPDFCKNRTSSFSVDDNLKDYIRACRNYLETKAQMLTGPVSLRGNIRLNDAKVYDEDFERLMNNTTDEIYDPLRIWLGDIPCFGGYSKAFDSAFGDPTTSQDIEPFVKAFIPLPDYQKVQLLIGAGYKGNNMGYADAYTRKRIFFGGGERWNVVFVNDYKNINPIVVKLIQDYKAQPDISELIKRYKDSAIKDSFAYYMLTYPAALTSTGKTEKEPDYRNASFYYAVEGELDDMDIISIRSITGQPLSKEHIDPLISAAICTNLETFNKVKSSINYKYRQSDNDGISIKGSDGKFSFRVVTSKNGWYVKEDTNCILKNDGTDANNYIVAALEGEDKVQVGRRIIKAIANTLGTDSETSGQASQAN